MELLYYRLLLVKFLLHQGGKVFISEVYLIQGFPLRGIPQYVSLCGCRKWFPKRIRGVYTASLNRFETTLKPKVLA